MVSFAQKLIYLRGDIQGVVYGAGPVEKDHAGYKYCQGCGGHASSIPVCFEKQRGGGQDSQDHGDEMGDGAAGIFDLKFKFHMDVSFLL